VRCNGPQAAIASLSLSRPLRDTFCARHRSSLAADQLLGGKKLPEPKRKS
jgi:hypothetical protein